MELARGCGPRPLQRPDAPRPGEGHWQQQQGAAQSQGEWEEAGRCTGVCCGWMGLPQDPAWRRGELVSCSAGPAPRGLSRAPLPDSGSGKDRQTSVAGSAVPWPVIQGITDWHSVLNRSWTHHRSINDLVKSTESKAEAHAGGPVKTPSAAPPRVLVRLPGVRAAALPRRLRQGAGQPPSSAPSSSDLPCTSGSAWGRGGHGL